MRIFQLMMMSLFMFMASQTFANNGTDTAKHRPETYMMAYSPDSSYYALQIASRKFVALNDSSLADVWLVGAVHVGTRQYYQDLQKLMDACDCVLFECVSHVDVVIQDSDTPAQKYTVNQRRMNMLSDWTVNFYKRKKALPTSLKVLRRDLMQQGEALPLRMINQMIADTKNPVKMVLANDELTFTVDTMVKTFSATNMPTPKPDMNQQKMLAKAIGIKFQLNEIRYDRAHFHHCDFTPEDMIAACHQYSLDSDIIESLQNMTEGNPFTKAFLNISMSMIASNPLSRNVIKYTMIEVLGNTKTSGLLGELGFLILDARNDYVFAEARPYFSKHKSVAIFYGAAHMDGVEKDLVKMGYTPVETRWFTGFDINVNDCGISRTEFEKIRQSLKDGLNF